MVPPTVIDPDALLSQAIIHHQAGRLVDAEKLYRAFLAYQPGQPDAHHNLGVVAMQTGRVDEGLPYFKKALDINPSNRQYWLSYAKGLLCAGQIETANATLQKAIDHGLRDEDVRALQQRVIAAWQKNASVDASGAGIDPTAQLVGLLNAGRYPEMETAAQKMLETQPNHGDIWRLLGVALSMQGRDIDAVTALERASTLLANNADVWAQLGTALVRVGQPQKALLCYAHSVEIDPKAEIWLDFSACAYTLGRFEEACRYAERALALNPYYAEAYNNLGIALNDLGRLPDAAANYRRALELKPGYPQIHSNLGNTLRNQGNLQDAIACYRHALELKPDDAVIYGNLGGALQDLGQRQEAVACYRRALELKPDYAAVFSGLLFCLLHMEDADPAAVFAEHLIFGERFETPLRAEWRPHGNDRTLDRKLKIGFVSADLRRHAVAHFIEPVWRTLDKTRLDLYVYSNHLSEDEVTVHLKELVGHWRQVVRLSDQELADCIRADGVDILFDLSGHTANHRLLTFARKPAPVQVTWIGYPGTTGLRAMDYKLTDRSAPPGMFDHLYVEKFACLPGVIMFEPAADSPEVNALPALAQGYITFGSFNRTSKLGDRVIALWSQVLQALPTSRMLVGSVTDDSLKTTLVECFARHGVSSDRLEFRPRVGMRDYLQIHHEVDIILDTFPYTGGTTTHHALWMGVPTLTLTGPTRSHCQSARILWGMGLSEWVTSTEEQFVSQAAYWATHLPELAMLRAGLRERFNNSPLRCLETVANGLEKAMRIMWRRWCAGLPPERFEVTL